MDLLGIRWVGLNETNGRRLLISVALLVAVVIGRYILAGISRLLLPGESRPILRARFWTRQGINLLAAVVLVCGIISIWFNDPKQLTTAIGLVTAGLAFALQQVVTAVAGYFVILRGNNFTVGDRITMGGVRGDVVNLGFIQTTIMEMGQPPSVMDATPAMWVHSRQFTGRIVTISNAKIFDEPVYNYTRDFPYIWDELSLPISYKDDRHRAEQILLKAAKDHALNPDGIDAEAMQNLERRYHIRATDLEPRVFWRLTDNWIEMTVRFIYSSHGIRYVKDAMSRDIIAALDEAKIGVASGTYEIVGVPPIVVKNSPMPAAS